MAKQPSSELAARMAVIGCQPQSYSRSVETKAVRSTKGLKDINAASIISILLGQYNSINYSRVN